MTPAKILIVEDERITAESVKCTLEDLGYEVCAIVATGADAIEKATQKRPDLVLMDIVLQGAMDGIEAADRIRTVLGIPVVYATAYADEPFLLRAKVTAPYGYIIKPFTARELHSNIEIALHKSRLDQQIARLNSVLDSIRRVNQLILREHDLDHLLQNTCSLLIEHRGYAFAWAILFDENGKVAHSAHAGFGPAGFQPMIEMLNSKRYPSCVRKTLACRRDELMKLQISDCPDCPLSKRYPCDQALAIRLEPSDRSHGIFYAGAPVKQPIDESECILFREVADDISVALRAIQAETERSETERALRHAQKMEAIGQLAAGVAHDFNNLLMAISGYTELSIEKLTPDHQAVNLLREIEVAVRHATGVTRGLLTFSGRSSVQKEPVNLQQLLQECVKLLHHLLPAIIELKVDAPPKPALMVHADPTQMQQVLFNLVINARDAMPSGGLLRITLSSAHQEKSEEMGMEKAGEKTVACISVSDTGTGMSPEVQARILEPFFTTKERGRGTGLGLAIIHGIVQEHGGRLEINSTLGAGSTFRIFLPLIESSAAPVEIRTMKDQHRGHGEYVLVAEDDWHVREIITTALRGYGYRVIQAGDGAELIDRYHENRSELRLLLLDVDMPRRSGLDCLAEIRASGDVIPAIVISGARDDSTEKLDPHTILMQKPFRLTELMRCAAQALARIPSRKESDDIHDQSRARG